MTRASIEPILEGFCFLANLFAILSVLRIQLYRIYPVFFAFLLLHLVIDGTAVIFSTGSLEYFYTFFTVESVLYAVYLLMVWELFSAIFRDYAGLRSLSRWVMGGAAALGGVVSVGLLGAAWVQPHFQKHGVFYLANFERVVSSAIIIFVIILLFFISRYPIKLPRNSIVQSLLCSLWFIVDATYAMLWIVLPKSYAPLLDAVQIVAQGCLFLAWGILLSKAGQEQPGRVRRNISPEREIALIGELDALNDSLLRAGRSISHSHTGKH